MDEQALKPTRPPLRWFGGKWRLAPGIIDMMPKHRYYVEPFAGAASVLLRKPRCYSETINDLDGEIVNLFKVLRDSHLSGILIQSVKYTAYSRMEFVEAYQKTEEPVERARRLIIRSLFGFGGGLGAHFKSTGFRCDAKKMGSTPAADWRNYPDALEKIAERMMGVAVESVPALDIIDRTDDPETLFYMDPPYVHETRTSANWHNYAHEMDTNQHAELLKRATELDGMVMISGYSHSLYDEMLCGWGRKTFKAYADGAREREEVLWFNQKVIERIGIERTAGEQLEMIE